MDNKLKVYRYKTLETVVTRLRSDLKDFNFVLLYAYNGTGKTRLSMAFKDKQKRKGDPDTLYYNAFTEDLFTWNNDLENDVKRFMKINSDSKFLGGFKELALEERIASYLQRYAVFDFKIDYENWKINFNKNVKNPEYHEGDKKPMYIVQNDIKISRGEENIFIWCIFLAICELAIDGAEAYKWVKFFYIDDPISSLDDNNAIGVATDLARLLIKGKDKIKVVISSHHNLFFNVICNELKKDSIKRYFLHKNKYDEYTLQNTDNTPFFHHVALLSELKQAADSGNIKTYHFNVLRSILEKTSSFFGFNDFSKCIYGIEDEALFSRALNLLSHGAYSLYTPVEMNEDNKNLFKKILDGFLRKYEFDLPELLKDETN